MKRLMFEGPNWDGYWNDHPEIYPGPDGPDDPEWVTQKGFREFLKLFREKPSGGHAGDEYGNCSLYFRCGLFGIVWFYPTGHYQTDVLLPEPQQNAWVDRVFYRES